MLSEYLQKKSARIQWQGVWNWWHKQRSKAHFKRSSWGY